MQKAVKDLNISSSKLLFFIVDLRTLAFLGGMCLKLKASF